MTEIQRKAIEILNRIKAVKHDDGMPVISDDDYFFLLSFVIDKPQEIQYVPQLVPTVYPPPAVTPLYDWRYKPYEPTITCKNE